ncbi:hypothetical protein NMG60_11024272 [Bertholletia excelsa]
MAKSKLIIASAFLLLLLVTHGIMPCMGRRLQSTATIMDKDGSRGVGGRGFRQPVAEDKEDFQPAVSGEGTGGHYRPTGSGPGHSPGIGHSANLVKKDPRA